MEALCRGARPLVFFKATAAGKDVVVLFTVFFLGGFLMGSKGSFFVVCLNVVGLLLYMFFKKKSLFLYLYKNAPKNLISFEARNSSDS